VQGYWGPQRELRHSVAPPGLRGIGVACSQDFVLGYYQPPLTGLKGRGGVKLLWSATGLASQAVFGPPRPPLIKGGRVLSPVAASLTLQSWSDGAWKDVLSRT
jgi:hypothetical protein